MRCIVLLACVLVLVMAVTVMAGAPQPVKPALDQVELGVEHRAKALRSLGAINNGKPTESQKKIAKLTLKGVAYYPGTQSFPDKLVDKTARAVIDNPERVAYRKKLKDDKFFIKTVGSASSLLKAHEKLTPKKKAKKVAKKL